MQITFGHTSSVLLIKLIHSLAFAFGLVKSIPRITSDSLS